MANVLVTGGAGYIGSHTVQLLCNEGHTVTVVDDLSNGHRDAVDARARFVEADITTDDLARAFDVQYDAVIHFAGKILVGESVQKPELYERINVAGSKNLLEHMNCDKIIFSSSAAVYGEPTEVPIPEDTQLLPVNPYGQNKLDVEKILEQSDVSYVALRYFNAAGASSDSSLGERHDPETHLIPLVLLATEEKPLKIFGTDYDTKDGTCIRDYIHVEDLARAHVLAMEHLLKGGESYSLNLGSGSGYSVREIIIAAEEILGRKVPVVEDTRRAGDPAVLVAKTEKAKEVLGWEPQQDVRAMVETAWKYFEKVA